jgi:hypothetical protein
MLTTNALNWASKFIGLTFQDFQTSFDLNVRLATLLNVGDEMNQNLTAAQKELLLVWHQKWAHAAKQRCQVILIEPQEDRVKKMIKLRNKQASSCRLSICAAYQLGKQGQTSVRATTQDLLPNWQKLLWQNNLKPGDKVSIDQYMTATHEWCVHNTKGKEAKSQQYVGSKIFVDHAMTLIHHACQVSLWNKARFWRAWKIMGTLDFVLSCG